jgi:Na+-translocating ferredoxin:NAD+ oxidoreductase RnfG subunit
MNKNNWLLLPPLLAASTSFIGIQVAQAEVYFTTEQAQKASFPGAKSFNDKFLNLSDETKKQIDKLSGTKPVTDQQKFWQVVDKAGQVSGYFVLDKVYGKHEYITYSVALTPNGTVKNVEILEYRETYGGEIRDASWRKQFEGVTKATPLVLGKDIKNISGATLSCRHITDGVKRVLITFDLLVKNKK